MQKIWQISFQNFSKKNIIDVLELKMELVLHSISKGNEFS